MNTTGHSDHQCSREALLESEKRFRMAASAAKIGIYSRDLQSGIDYWSPEFLAIYGLGPDDTLPLKDGLPAAIHPDDLQDVAAARNLFVLSHSEFNSEHRIVRPDGQIRWVMVRGVHEFDTEGKPLRTHGLVMDITASKATEEELRRSREELAKELSATRSLQEISTQFIQDGEMVALYEKLLDTAVAFLECDFASIQMLHPDRGPAGELQLLGYRGFNREAAEFWQWVGPASKSACGVALRIGRRVLVPDVKACDFMAGSRDAEVYLQTGFEPCRPRRCFRAQGF
jgi:PAS domain S-box-containing protein